MISNFGFNFDRKSTSWLLAEYFRVNLFRFDENSKSMDPGYPQDVENWRGVPRNIDAVFTSVFDGRTYFFKGGIHKLR